MKTKIPVKLSLTQTYIETIDRWRQRRAAEGVFCSRPGAIRQMIDAVAAAEVAATHPTGVVR